MLITYKTKRFKTDSLQVIADAAEIIEEYDDKGFSLTLRQLYYQFIARDIFPEERRWTWTGRKWIRDPQGTKNADPNYKWLGGIVNDARLAGHLSWLAIEDRTRSPRGESHWKNPSEIVEAAVHSYSIDKWENQEYYLEVWVEKDALVQVVARACRQLDLTYFACRGYVSQSAMWRAAERFRVKANDPSNKKIILLHLGDHDPSGIDMTRDIQDRLLMFGAPAAVLRIALNMDQIEELEPPPSPAKLTDARAKDYIAEFGDDSWELVALEPDFIMDLITKHAESWRDEKKWKAALKREAKEKGILKKAAKKIKDSMKQ